MVFCFGVIALGIHTNGHADWVDQATADRLVRAVETAFFLDTYHSRCRADGSGRRTENLNKELVSHYRTTVLNVQDDWFPEHYYRDAQARMERDFLEQLRAYGGCQSAKDAGWLQTLQQQHHQALEQLLQQR
jgi:hypothetical protein